MLLLVLMVLGCATTKTRKIDAPDRMQTEIGALIRPGMTIEEVESALKIEGFQCTIERNASFVAMKSWSEKEPPREAIDFVRCNRTNNAGFLMGRVWSVAILLDGGKATGEVLVSHFVDGP
ncbi:hypothetical protein SH449x_005252 [Pirellulaceae bacterium SH449]